MGLEKFCKAWHILKSICSKAHKQNNFWTLDTNKKDYKLILFLELDTQSFSKTSQHQTCRAIYKEQKKLILFFFWFFHNFLEFFKVH